MAKRTLGDDQTALVRASIGSVFYRKNAFDKWGEKRVTRLLNNVTKVIDHYLDEVGQAVSERARTLLEEYSSGSGHHYLIVDELGDILHEWDASSPGDPPATVTGLLQRSIEYRIGSGKDRADFVEIGVWSEEEWMFETIAFEPPKPEEKRKKYSDQFGKIIVGEGGHTYPVKLYAFNMEKGFHNKKYGWVEPRPFLKPAFIEVVMEQRKEYQKEMKNAFIDAFREKVPISFRIYVGKEFQEKG
jgi:hypothetical protein